MAVSEQISLPVQRRVASVVSDSINEKAGTVDVVWTTGSQVRRYDWWKDKVFYEELEVTDEAVRLERLNDGASVLDTHQNWSLDNIIGVTERAWIEEGEGRATLRMDRGDEVSKKRWQKIIDGIIRHISVGYSILSAVEIREEDRTIIRATDWEPQEISFVPIGADPGAGVRSEEQPTHICNLVRASDDTLPEGENMPKKIEPKEEEVTPSTPDDASSRNAPPTDDAPPSPPADGTRQAQESVASEIVKVCRTAGADLSTANDMIERGISPTQARDELLARKASASETEISTQHRSDGVRQQPPLDPSAIYRTYNGEVNHG
ncbi:MAG: hypothetical protein ABJN40_13190 [Sneathiella sp.]